MRRGRSLTPRARVSRFGNAPVTFPVHDEDCTHSRARSRGLPMLDFSSLRTAIILLDRPLIGIDGHRAQDRLPPTLRLRATVVGQGPVACSIACDAVRALVGRERPTFGDLEAVWQHVAQSIDE